MKKMNLNTLMGLLFSLLVTGCTGTGLTYHVDGDSDKAKEDKMNQRKEGFLMIARIIDHSTLNVKEGLKSINFQILEKLKAPMQKVNNPGLAKETRLKAFKQVSLELEEFFRYLRIMSGSLNEDGTINKANPVEMVLEVLERLGEESFQAETQQLIDLLGELTNLIDSDTNADGIQALLKTQFNALKEAALAPFLGALIFFMKVDSNYPRWICRSKDLNKGLELLNSLVVYKEEKLEIEKFKQWRGGQNIVQEEEIPTFFL